MNIQLPTGATISVSVYDYYFLLDDDEVEQFMQNCVADNLGTFIENPFANRAFHGKLELPEDPEIEEIPEDPFKD